MKPALMKHYLVLLFRRPQLDPAVVPLHQQFLQELHAQGHNELFGRFSNPSPSGQAGGAYLLRAETIDEAWAIVHRDPAYTSGGWDMTVYEWMTH